MSANPNEIHSLIRFRRPGPLARLKKFWTDHRKRIEHRERLKLALHRLRTEPVDEASGRAIIELMEQSPKSEYVGYAREWIEKFPDGAPALRLIGTWLAVYKSDEAIAHARTQLRTTDDTGHLFLLVERCVTDRRVFLQLEDDLATRMESNSSNGGWYSLQSRFGSVKEADALSLRWLNLNVSNRLVVHCVQFMVCNTKSDVVREGIADWALQSVETEWIELVIFSLLDCYEKMNKATKQKTVVLVRQWLNSQHDPDKNYSVYGVGAILASLVVKARMPEDIEFARKWYETNSTKKDAHYVQAAILKTT